MLSEREERELLVIEQGLLDDGRFTYAFPSERRPLHRRPWVVRTAIAFGLVLILAGLVLSASGLALQGLLLAGGSYAWWCWKLKPSSRKPVPAPRADRRWWGFPPVY
ncbi:MAG TPA: DUF3040 domain-containing protein [Mycobacteriales bacterium]|jgi:hypothetical protein